MKKKIIAAVLAVVVILGIVYLRVLAKNRSESSNVKVSTAVKGEVKAFLSTTATIKSKSSKEYYGSQLKIKSVNVKVGDAVKKGQVLINYDLQDMNTSAQQAQIQYNNAVLQKQDALNQNNDINNKIRDLDSQISNLQNSKSPSDIQTLTTLKTQRSQLQPISREKLQQLDNSIALAKVTLDSANSKMNSIRNGIVSDIDGVVTTLNAVEGAVGNPAQPIVIVQDLNNLKAVVSLGKYDAEKVKVGQETEIKSGNKTYKGKVTFISPAAVKTVSASGSDTALTAEIDVLDKADDLKIDFDSDVDILLGDEKDVLKIPVESIKYDKTGKNLVYIDENGIAKQRQVKLGLQSDADVQVIQGIKAGDRVILNPTAAISDGTKVTETSEGAK